MIFFTDTNKNLDSLALKILFELNNILYFSIYRHPLFKEVNYMAIDYTYI